MKTQPLNRQAILAIAVPVMLSNLSTPLIGVVDTAIVGQLGDAYHIGAVAIGALIFSFVFWAFGFLRMSTTGFTAQSEGAGDDQGVRDHLFRALTLALVCGVVLIIISPLIKTIAFNLIDGSLEVERYGALYFDIRIWSAPAALANYAFYGWFIGLGRARTAFIFMLLVNGANIALDALFVLHFAMAADGVALGTLISEYFGCLCAAIFAVKILRQRTASFNWATLINPARIKVMLAANLDVMIRSVSLIFAFSWFTTRGAAAGDVVLAGNAILFELFMIVCYFLDGFAFAAETHVGRALGAKNRDAFWRTVILSSQMAFAVAAISTVLFFFTGPWLTAQMSVNPDVVSFAYTYLPWAAIAPLTGFACFQLDGIFIGATRTSDMRNMMLVSLMIYLIAWWLLTPVMGNHGLWAAINIFFIARAVTLACRLPALDRTLFQAVK